MKKSSILIFIIFTSIISQAQTWTQKADLPAAGRYGCISFSIGNKGYIGLGNDASLVDYDDLWEWDQNTNTWAQKANFPGAAREAAGSFAIGNKGYVVLGYGNGNDTKELWEWDGDVNSPNYNTWTRKADFAGAARIVPVCFSIGKKGYVGTGSYAQDFWEWDGDTASATYNTWTKRADFGGGQRGWATGFSIGNKGYIGMGTDGAQYRVDFWEWDGDTSSPTFDTWTQLSNFPGGIRISPSSFSIGNKGYVGFGWDNANVVWAYDFWQLDPSNGWMQKISFPGSPREEAATFSINGLGYVGTGGDNGNLKDLWEYCDTCPSINVEELEMQTGISVYPNPANQNLFIRTKQDNYNDLQLKIIDMLGQEKKIAVLKSNNIKLDISELPEGVYFVSVKGPEGTLTKKIVIEH